MGSGAQAPGGMGEGLFVSFCDLVPCPKPCPGARPSRHPFRPGPPPPRQKPPPYQTRGLLWSQDPLVPGPLGPPKPQAPGPFPPARLPQALPMNHSGWNLMSSGLPAQCCRPLPPAWPVGSPHPPRGSSQQLTTPTGVHHGVGRPSGGWDRPRPCGSASVSALVCMSVYTSPPVQHRKEEARPSRAGALGVSVAARQGWVCVEESLWSRSPRVSVSLCVSGSHILNPKGRVLREYL